MRLAHITEADYNDAGNFTGKEGKTSRAKIETRRLIKHGRLSSRQSGTSAMPNGN